jgi:hypothetical protein
MTRTREERTMVKKTEERWPEPVYLTKDHAINMSLRDYFAAKAMEGFLSAPDTGWQGGELAEQAYKMADAMLKAREA